MQEATAGNPVLRARARARARTHGHEAGARPAAAGARHLAGAARRPPRPAARPRRAMSCSKSQRSRGRRSIWWRPRTEIASASSRHSRPAADEGVVELDDSADPLRAPAARLDLLRAGAGLEAPSRAPSAGDVVTDVEERARHLALAAEGPDAGVASEPGHGRRARCRTRRARRGGRPLRARGRAHPGRSRRWHCQRRLRSAHLPPPCRRRGAGCRDAQRAACTEAPSGVERADVLFELALTRRAERPEDHRALRRGACRGDAATTRARRGFSLPELMRLFQADVREALVDARAALEKAERAGDPALLAVAIARVGHAEMWAAEITPGLSSGELRSRSARVSRSSSTRARAWRSRAA